MRLCPVVVLIALAAACGREGSLVTYNVVDVVCGRDRSTTVSVPEVSAGPNGVHVRVHNEHDGYVTVSDLNVGSTEGTTERVSYIRPGSYAIACSLHSSGDDRAFGHAWLRVLDPYGYWVEHEIRCESGGMTTVFDGGPAARAVGEPPVLGKRHFSGLKPTDVVMRAGYPQTAEYAIGKVIRSGETIAVAFFRRSGPRWSPSHIQACQGAGLGVRL